MSAIGGSITAGSSYGTSTKGASFLYHQKVLRAVNQLHPAAAHTLQNGGVPGTGPTYMEHCVHDHLPPQPDLILLEYAVNTDRNPAAFERLLRTILLLPRSPALMVVNAHRWRAIRPHDGRTDKCWHPKWPLDMVHNKTQWAAQRWGSSDEALNADEEAIAALCKHYGVPLVSMRGALLEEVRSGRGPMWQV